MAKKEYWEKLKLEGLIRYSIGGDWGRKVDNTHDGFAVVRCIRGSEFKNWHEEKGSTASLRLIKTSSLEKRKLQENDILLEISGGGPGQPVGRTVLVDNVTLNKNVETPKVYTNFLKLIRLSGYVNARYINNYLNYFYRSGKIETYQAGSNNLRNLKFREFKEINVPIPGILEQHQIVKRIEELFTELDKSIENLKRAKARLKLYRQAVLKKTFEGNYPMMKIAQISHVRTGATPKRGKNEYWSRGDIPWITSSSLNKPFVDKAKEYITQEALNHTNCKIIPKESLLVAMYGEGKTRGKCSELAIEACTNQAIAAITLHNEHIKSKNFIKWFFQKNYDAIRLKSSGGVQPNLNLSIVKNTELPFPDPNIQDNIVKGIETRLSLCDQLENTIESNLQKEKALRQSILKKAFEGELTREWREQNPDLVSGENSAKALLERIKKNKNISQQNK